MDPEKLKVVELRTELAQRGLDTKGVKSVLVERLRKALEEENANQGNQGKADTNAQNANDDMVQENDEKSAKSTRPPQTPKKSSRLSKTAPMTPREDPATKKRRTSRMSYSRRRTSPKKSDQNDMSRESSPSDSTLHDEAIIPEADSQEEADALEKTEIQAESIKHEEPISEKEIVVEDKLNENEITKVEDSTSKEEDTKQEEKPQTPEKNEQKDRKSLVGEEESTNSMEVMEKDEKENYENTEGTENKNDIIVSDTTTLASPLKCNNETKSTIEGCKDDENISSQNEEPPECGIDQERSESISTGESKVNVGDANESDAYDKNDNADSKLHEDDNNIIQSTIEDNIIDIPVSEEQEKALLEEDIDINEDDKLKAELFEVKESEKEADDNINDKQEEECVEMTNIEFNEDTDIHMKEKDTNDVRDKKRKRSLSPLQYCEESFSPVVIENEPEIDDSALILSWYDSDLNLVIAKDGFFTATPMHNDGFSHMWAGARASYGFLCGKVYYEAKIVEYCAVNTEKEEQPHVLRIGWSTPYTSMQLGEEKFSFGYSSTGKKITDNQYEDYGLEFGADDIIGCYCDATSDNIILSYTVNGKDQGIAFSIPKKELDDKPIFPHILSKNCSFACNFGQETPWNKEILENYVSIGNVESQYKIPGLRRPERKEECEVIMMCGLPACGKTTWATKYATENPQKMYNILGLSSLINKMKEPGQSYEEEYAGEWKKLIDKCTHALDRLMEIASRRRRNYILDQTNTYPSAQRRKMKNFYGYQRKAVVLVPSEEEFKSRSVNHKTIEGMEVTDNMLLEMKANFRAPVVGESFDMVDWVELNQEEGEKIIERYNKEGKEAGYGEQHIIKRARTDSRSGVTYESRNDVRSSRDNRDNRDYRDRRNNYADRNRNPVWHRGTGNMGWRHRPQRGGGGPIRHARGYGPPAQRRRRGAPIPLVHHGMNRRGGNGDRRGNDRGRALGSRQGPRPRAPIGNYQGAQQTAWNQQGNWSNQSQDDWGQQNNWGSQPWGSWKGYGQSSYNQGSYQQGYGNGNWNSWNPQYYNQYWGQQQQSGQTTTTSGQAANKQ